MTLQLVTIIISALGMGGMVSGIVLHRLARMEKRQDSREEARMQESILVIQGLKACGHLSEANAIAFKRGAANGETETALAYYHDFTKNLNDYLLKQNAERNHG
jgi:hypothetical protein